MSFSGAIILFLGAGCAAPMTEAVITRPETEIDRMKLKEGDEVLITYKDNSGITKEKIGTIASTNRDSITLRPFRQRGDLVKIDQFKIVSFGYLSKNIWSVNIWTGIFETPAELWAEEAPDQFRTLIGVSPRYFRFTNHALQGSFLFGKGVGEFSKWVGFTISSHWYTKIPRTYFHLGTGLIWSIPTDESKIFFARWDQQKRSPLKLFRWGLGSSVPVFFELNARLELETGLSSYGSSGTGHGLLLGFRIYLERGGPISSHQKGRFRPPGPRP